MLKQSLSIGVMAVSGLALTVPPGCSGGATIGGATATIINPVNNEPIFRGTLKDVVINPATPQLPPGSTHIGTGTINGHEVEIFEAPDGCTWIVDSDGDPHKIAEGAPDLGDDGNPNPQPIGVKLQGSQMNQSVTYAFDEASDSAVATVTLPVSHMPNYLPASALPFLVQETGVQLPNGDLRLTYTGTINDVLGALWWIGFNNISFTDPNGVPVDVHWASNMNVAIIEAGSASEMLVMTPTNLANWNND